MKNLSKILLSFMLGVTLLFSGALTAEERYEKQKVVYHINNDNPKQNTGALRNIQNHINAVGAKNLDLKVVLHGNGLALLVLPDALKDLPKFKNGNATDEMSATIDHLKGQGVTFNVCANTVKGRQVNIEDHLYNVEESDIVPSGVAELAHLQSQGYTYIKP
uniref:Uncharacterized protein n=1 Tax=uncultured Thiotrichaceae bacterium TaxID=298394 RepID=A0A6S6UAR6_9GAMM|nr:MAG: Blr3520 protein homolog, hypothetical protein [uncultured Thiotrichaceae bacterium]